MTHSSYAAIILAAGLSSRIDSFKPLLTINGQTLIDKVITLFSNKNIDVYIVAGHRQAEISNHLRNCDINVIKNRDYLIVQLTSMMTTKTP